MTLKGAEKRNMTTLIWRDDEAEISWKKLEESECGFKGDENVKGRQTDEEKR